MFSARGPPIPKHALGLLRLYVVLVLSATSPTDTSELPMLRALGARMRAVAPPPRPLLLRARGLCESAAEEGRKAELLEFLRSASRPIMGKAKARQSAGQKPLDLTRQMKNLDDVDVGALLRMGGAELARRGVPVQERKRLLRFTDKYVQGYRHDGRQGKHAWRGFLPPYKQPGHPTNYAHTGKRPYNDHVPSTAPADLSDLEPLPPPADVLLGQWVEAMRAKDYATADGVREELRSVGVEPSRVKPILHAKDDAPAG